MVDHLYSYRALTYMGKSDHVMYVILSPPKSTFSCIHQPNTNYAHSHITVLLSCDLVTCTLVSHSHSILLSISTMYSVGLWERGSARWMCICKLYASCKVFMLVLHTFHLSWLVNEALIIVNWFQCPKCCIRERNCVSTVAP
jgi:hypothetical protein